MTERIIIGLLSVPLGVGTMLGTMWLCVRLWPDKPHAAPSSDITQGRKGS